MSGVSAVGARGGRLPKEEARTANVRSQAASPDAAEASTIREPDGNSENTIVALSSGTGRSAVAVIRLSGPRSGKDP